MLLPKKEGDICVGAQLAAHEPAVEGMPSWPNLLRPNAHSVPSKVCLHAIESHLSGLDSTFEERMTKKLEEWSSGVTDYS